MTDQLISFETAKLAKEKGFDGKCHYWIHKKDYIFEQRTFPGINKYYQDGPIFYNWNDRPSALSVPTQSLLQKWLREVHDIHIYIEPLEGNEYEFTIISDKYTEDEECDDVTHTSYESALEGALIDALKLIP